MYRVFVSSAELHRNKPTEEKRPIMVAEYLGTGPYISYHREIEVIGDSLVVYKPEGVRIGDDTIYVYVECDGVRTIQ